MEQANGWYLLKKDESEPYGPVSLDQLRRWALAAQISPMDLISKDRETWLKAPMNPALEMDWLIQLSVDQFYGPTSLGSVNEFLEAGEIDVDTLLINCVSGEVQRIGDMDLEVVVQEEEVVEEVYPEMDTASYVPERTAIGVTTQDKATALEQALIEERRELKALWERFNRLYRMYEEATGEQPNV